MAKEIKFNWPYTTGKEFQFIEEAIHNRKLSGNGPFTQKCQSFFQERYGFKKALLTTSCTDALEMCAMLAEIKEGDEVIIPSYTFVSTALAFVRQGANVVFADSRADHPGIEEESIECLITPRTKAIVPVHYAGVACDMDKIMTIADKHNLLVIEDAAQAVASYYKGRPLGSIGHLAAFSFHETKNISCGEGGLLAINDERFSKRAEILWEKGTDRAKFFRGEIDKYGWVDLGSSFLPSEILAAFLYAQLLELENIQQERVTIWNRYHSKFSHSLLNSDSIQLPFIPPYATNNAHMFYIICKSLEARNNLIGKLKSQNIHAVFHYLSLHRSTYYTDKYNGSTLEHADRYSECLLRLPFYIGLSEIEINLICNEIIAEQRAK